MLGVIRLIFSDDVESMSGDDDFFSVARTMPLVACSRQPLSAKICPQCKRTLDTQRGNTLVDGGESIL
jgi:hypothetical protein